jgi:hypothetical protein
MQALRTLSETSFDLRYALDVPNPPQLLAVR